MTLQQLLQLTLPVVVLLGWLGRLTVLSMFASLKVFFVILSNSSVIFDFLVVLSRLNVTKARCRYNLCVTMMSTSRFCNQLKINHNNPRLRSRFHGVLNLLPVLTAIAVLTYAFIKYSEQLHWILLSSFFFKWMPILSPFISKQKIILIKPYIYSHFYLDFFQAHQKRPSSETGRFF